MYEEQLESELNEEQEELQDTAEVEEEENSPAADPKDERIAALESEVQELKNELLRAMAEAQTIQRRMRENHEQSMKFATEPLVQEILPVLDNFDRTIKAFQEGASTEKLVAGVQQVNRQLQNALGSVNVQKIEAEGKQFDPELHEALATLDSEEHEPNTVLVEIESGYKMSDRVIRPAKVQVSKKP